ncbi:MAG: DNA cytosine methyltransferase [Clostridiales bacterium]|jgi:DNA (cytosine-5)-methyltransferase 1|nr:DNA cytosine methyltransferase [Clostridiales bacterium]
MNKVIDLFAGCGGFSTGFIRAGFDISYAVEFDVVIAKTYAKNHPSTNLIVDDIKNVDQNGTFKKGMADIIIGGPPCQGFSMAGARIRGDFIDDPRNYLFKHYYNIVKVVQPPIFIIENVKGISTMQGGKIFAEILKSFKEIGYNVQHKVFLVSEFGVPQNRERMIIIGVKNKEWKFDDRIASVKNRLNLAPKTVWDAIADLEHAPTDGSCAIANHTSTKHNKKAVERMGKIASGENFMALDENIKSVHSGSYGRLEKDKPSQTITTRFDTPSGGKFIHPTLNRTITPREAARLQSFPDNFVFLGNKTSICKQIGNAVPPQIGYILAEIIKEVL